jgi:hypothetical protein
MELDEVRGSKAINGIYIEFGLAVLSVVFMLGTSAFDMSGDWGIFLHLNRLGVAAFGAAMTTVLVTSWFFTQHVIIVNTIKSHPELTERLSVLSHRGLGAILVTMILIGLLVRLLP